MRILSVPVMNFLWVARAPRGIERGSGEWEDNPFLGGGGVGRNGECE